MLSIAIADDEEVFRNRIKDFLESYLDSRTIRYELKLFKSGSQLIDVGEDIRKFDIFFLDVSMRDADGIKTAKTIRKYSRDAFIVFVTAYIDYSIEGYKVNAVRYVLKNDNLEDSLTECMDTILKKMTERKPVIQLHFNEGIKDVPIDKILYIESGLHRLTFHFSNNNNVFTMYQTLNTMERELSGYNKFV